MNDTAAAADAVVRAALLGRDPVERMRDALAHSETMRLLALSRLQERFPHLDTRQLVEKLLGDSLARIVGSGADT